MEQWSFFIVGVARKGRDTCGRRLQPVGIHSGLMPLLTRIFHKRSAVTRESTESASILLKIVFDILPVCLQTISCVN